MSEELKPCPFCGDEANHSCHTKTDGDEAHTIDCYQCGAESGWGDGKAGLTWLSYEAAANSWNARHIPEGFALVPIKNIMKVERPSDQSVTIVTTSFRTASEIENVITAYQEGSICE